MFVSELDIEAAGLLVRQAEEDVRAAEQLPPTSTTGIAWASAQGRLRTAVANHARLVERRAVEQAAEAAAAKAEKAAAKRLGAMGEDLEASRARLHAAIVAAQDALVALTVATDEYDGLIATQHAELDALGMRLVDGSERTTGSRTSNMGVRSVVLAGAKWSPAGRMAVLQLVVDRVQRARQAVTHNGLSLPAFAQNIGLGYTRTDLDLGSVPLPPDGEKHNPTVKHIPLPEPESTMPEHERRDLLKQREVVYSGGTRRHR